MKQNLISFQKVLGAFQIKNKAERDFTSTQPSVGEGAFVADFRSSALLLFDDSKKKNKRQHEMPDEGWKRFFHPSEKALHVKTRSSLEKCLIQDIFEC